MENSIRVIKLVDAWYVETKTGYDGPFDSYEDAEAFQRLSLTTEAARMEFVGLDFVFN